MSRPRVKTTELARAAPVFAALGDVTRLALVSRLGTRGPLSITQLADGAGVTRQAVTKHLDVLANVGLVHDVRRGRERIWDLDTERLAAVGRRLDEISRQWDRALARLRRHVER